LGAIFFQLKFGFFSGHQSFQIVLVTDKNKKGDYTGGGEHHDRIGR
jgi:hypothetical protein